MGNSANKVNAKPRMNTIPKTGQTVLNVIVALDTQLQLVEFQAMKSLNFGWLNAEISHKMANGRMFFLALLLRKCSMICELLSTPNYQPKVSGVTW